MTLTRRRWIGGIAGVAFGLLALVDLIHFFYWLSRTGESTDAQIETFIALCANALLAVAAFLWGWLREEQH